MCIRDRGSWVYSPQDSPTTFEFLKRAYGIGLPLTKLISHRFKLDEIAEALETNVQMKAEDLSKHAQRS